jgi:EAL domain-containing protein (putative c-di-GMP-specific phosphodiesterase class I)
MNQASKPSIMWIDNRERLMDNTVLCVRFPLLDSLSRNQGPAFTANIRKLIENRVIKATESTTVLWSESAILVPVCGNTSRTMLDTMLQGLYERLIAPFSVQPESTLGSNVSPSEWYLTPFIGVKFPPHADYKEAIRCSKAAAHRASIEDMTTACLYDPILESQAAMELLQHQYLLKGIREEKLNFHYQPQVEMETGIIKGFESLIRPGPSKIPGLANMSAGQMIRLASETNLMMPMTEFVLNSAARTIRQWKAFTGDYPFTLSVNIDPYTLVAGWQRLEPLLRDPVFRRTLIVEITEAPRNGEMYDLAALNNRIQVMASMGIDTAIDDFGCGLANFDLITDMTFDELKLDQSLVSRAHEKPIEAAVIKAIIDANQSRGSRVVGEGIETPEQWEFLKNIGCDIGQGYLIGRPQPAQQAIQMLQRQIQRERRAWLPIKNQMSGNQI